MGRSRLRRMRFAMGIQSYFCCLTASRLPGNGIVERSSRSQWLHYAPGMKVLRIRKCLIVGTRSVRRASGLLETGLSVSLPVELASFGGSSVSRGCPKIITFWNASRTIHSHPRMSCLRDHSRRPFWNILARNSEQMKNSLSGVADGLEAEQDDQVPDKHRFD